MVAYSNEGVQSCFAAGLGLCADSFYDSDGVLSSCFVGIESLPLMFLGWWIWLLVLAAFFFG